MRSQEKTALNKIHRKPLLLERPKVLTKMCWKMGVFKASTTLLTFSSPWASTPMVEPLPWAALGGFCHLWGCEVKLPFLGTTEPLLRDSWEGVWGCEGAKPSFWGWCAVSPFFCAIFSSHVNVLSGCLFHEPIIFAQSIFAFKFNIFRKLCSFWRFAQVHLVPWRKLTMKSHSTQVTALE